MTTPPAFTLTWRDLRVVFLRCEDRWGHRVELVPEKGGPALPLVASVEVSPSADATPPSPPIQDMQMHEGPNGTCAALGVGMAGRNHWSLTCGTRQADPSRGEVDSISWEVACRVREGNPTLACSYRLLAPERIAEVEAGAVELAVDDRRFRLGSKSAILSITNEGFAITAEDAEQPTTPRTVQWSYSLSRDSHLHSSGQGSSVRNIILGKQPPRSMSDM